MLREQLSLVVPVYQGAPYLARLVEAMAALRAGLDAQNGPALLEAIFVIDGTDDGSSNILLEAQQRHDWLRLITLSRNFGQHPATVAGILHSSGDWVVTLDEDLQHPPQNISQLYATAMNEQADIVYAAPTTKTHESAFRRWSSVGSKKLVAWVSGVPEAVHFNSFRLIRGEIARGAASICGGDLYLDAALMWFTSRVHTCPMELVDPRAGDGNKSSYTITSLFSHAGRLLFSARMRVLRFGGLLGIAAMSVSLLYSVYILGRKLISPEAIPVSGWTSQMLVTLLIGGTLLFMLSILLEYITLIFLRVQGKPTYFTIERRGPAADKHGSAG